MRPPLPMSLAVVGAGSMAYLACGWADGDQDDFSKKVVGGSFMGGAMAFALLSFIASVMCCGCCMDSVIQKQKPVGGAVVFFAFICMWTPYASAILACNGVADEICAECVKQGLPPCGSPDRSAIEEGCKAIAAFIAYYLAFGWLTAILAWVAFGMGWCLICGCCNCKVGEELAKKQGGKPVGQPVR